MARRPDSTLAWLGTGLVVLSFPFVARATFDEYEGDAGTTEDALPTDAPPPIPTEDAPILDAAPPEDAAAPHADASTTTFGDDAGGISCAIDPRARSSIDPHARSSFFATAFVSLGALSIARARRRSSARRVKWEARK